MPNGSRRSRRLRRSLVLFAALVVVVAASAVALIATGQAGRLISLSPDRLPFGPIDMSQVGGAFDRGELPVEILIIGAAVALAIGTALPLLVAVVRRPRRSALSGAAPVEATDPLEAGTTFPWPIEDAAPHSAVRTQSPGAFEVGTGAGSLPSPALDAAQAEAQAAREAAADLAGLAPAVELTRVITPWSQAEQSASPEVARHLIPQASTIGTAVAPPSGEPRETRESTRPGPNLPWVAAVGTVAVGIAFSAGSAVGAALGAGVGAAIGLAFAGGAGAAIAATAALIGSRRS